MRLHRDSHSCISSHMTPCQGCGITIHDKVYLSAGRKVIVVKFLSTLAPTFYLEIKLRRTHTCSSLASGSRCQIAKDLGIEPWQIWYLELFSWYAAIPKHLIPTWILTWWSTGRPWLFFWRVWVIHQAQAQAWVLTVWGLCHYNIRHIT